MFVGVCMCACVSMRVHVCTCMSVCLCVYVCIRACVCVCVCINTINQIFHGHIEANCLPKIIGQALAYVCRVNNPNAINVRQIYSLPVVSLQGQHTPYPQGSLNS